MTKGIKEISEIPRKIFIKHLYRDTEFISIELPKRRAYNLVNVTLENNDILNIKRLLETGNINCYCMVGNCYYNARLAAKDKDEGLSRVASILSDVH